MKTVLKKHQEEARAGCVEAFEKYGFYALLMEMGTGKTLTTLAVFESLVVMKKCLRMIVIAPKTLCGTWVEEKAKHDAAPDAACFVYDSTKWKTDKAKKKYKETLWAKSQVFLVNIESFSRGIPEIMKDILPGALVVIDESSKIKNPSAIRTKNLLKIADKAAFRMILTGTEITNSPLDVYGQFEFLKKGIFGFKSFFMFKNYFAILVDKYAAGGRTFKDVVGYRHVDQLEAVVNRHAYRALIKDCLDLPERINAPIFVEKSAEQARMIKELKKECITLFESGELTVLNKAVLFGKFRQIVGGFVKDDAGAVHELKENPKLQALLDDLDGTSDKAIIWAAHVEEVKAIKRALGDEAVLYYGEMNMAEREAAIEAFRGPVRFFVGTPQCAGYGLNLQHCHIMYYYSRPTSPTDNWQSAARTHRAGQTHPCVYKPLVMRGTVDERIESLLEQKTDVLSAFQSGGLAEFLSCMGESNA